MYKSLIPPPPSPFPPPQLMSEARSSGGDGGSLLSPEVTQLVDYVWAEATQQLEEVHTCRYCECEGEV